MHRDLRKRVEELEGHVALLQGEGMAAALAAAEGQARTAQASLGRKDALIKALKERVDAIAVRTTVAGTAHPVLNNMDKQFSSTEKHRRLPPGNNRDAYTSSSVQRASTVTSPA
jgi:hypothetical protein